MPCWRVTWYPWHPCCIIPTTDPTGNYASVRPEEIGVGIPLLSVILLKNAFLRNDFPSEGETSCWMRGRGGVERGLGKGGKRMGMVVGDRGCVVRWVMAMRGEEGEDERRWRVEWGSGVWDFGPVIWGSLAEWGHPENRIRCHHHHNSYCNNHRALNSLAEHYCSVL